jgi:hypothetical protein
MSVSNLSGYQSAGRSANATTWDQIKQVANSFYGNMRDRVPPGSTIIEDDGGSRLTYRDADGYTHTLTRVLDGRSPEVGVIKDNTDKPLVAQQSRAGELDLAQQLVNQLSGNGQGQIGATIQPYLDQINQIVGQLQQPAALATLTPEDQALLDQISTAEQGQLNQRFNQDQGNLLARLYGAGINRSSVGNSALAQLLEAQGRLSQQQQADAAARNLGLRQNLANLGLQNLQTALGGLGTATQGQLQSFGQLSDLLQNLTGQATSRDINGANIAQQMRQLEEAARQFDVDTEFKNTQADIAVKQANKSGLLPSLLSTAASLALAPATGGGSLAGSVLSRAIGGNKSGGIGTYSPGGYINNQGIYTAA